MGTTPDRTERAIEQQKQKASRIREAKKLYEEGFSTIYIAMLLGIKPDQVDVYLQEN